MADLNWSYKLKGDQRANPVIHLNYIDLPLRVPCPNEIQLQKVFRSGGYKLQTWGRSVDQNGKTILKDDLHWIAVRKGTPLHYDPKYPRYSHHLKVRVDDGIYVRGLNREEMKLKRGTFYILDTHSPHQVFHKISTGFWNVAASIDSDDVLDIEEAKKRLLDFVINNTIDSK